jgi:hypothetical protein
MYKAYRLPMLDFNGSKTKLFEYGEKQIMQIQQSVFEKKIESFKNSRTGRLNAASLTADWFPQIDADIFISHSHQDYEDVVALAAWLHQNFNITAFVDECLWGFCEKLLKLIDDEYCTVPRQGFYDYNKRNYSTSHVYMMLAMSLVEMIYNTECLFFYNTPNSIVPKNVFASTEQTLSPWIFTELEMTKMVKTREPQEHRNRMLRKSITSEHHFSREELQVEYKVDLSHFIEIDIEFLDQWENKAQLFGHDKNKALDYLYENCEERGNVIYG